jgi:hypothetical protein
MEETTMQTDMHYYGTYAMARAAGLEPETCRQIASFAQFVDDNAEDKTIESDNGAIIRLVATAHHTTHTQNLQKDNQRYVWVPFHFLPGAEGEGYTERLKCRKNSYIAQAMVEHHLSLAGKPYAIGLMGVAAHVYADTFSHYGFSGISSRGNRVIQEGIEFHELSDEMREYITEKATSFWNKNGSQGGLFANFRKVVERQKEKAEAAAAEAFSGALGHGPVHTYPDRPYLGWTYQYEHGGESVTRNNHNDFMDACGALHAMFSRFADARPDLRSDGGKSFTDVQGAVSNVLSTQAGKEGRIQKWQDAAESGELFATGSESIPVYSDLEWLEQRDSLAHAETPIATLDYPVFRFYQAAAIHRTYVLRDLLPEHGLIVN